MSENRNRNSIYGLVGEKLGHSHSPFLHARFADYDYKLIEISKEEVEDFFKRAEFTAVNVTIPYKEVAMKHCIPDDNAKAIGCVNTLVNLTGEVKGYNTDTFGFEYMAKRAGIDFKGKRVAVLGSGGTCRTAVCTASRLGASIVTVVSRHPHDMGFATVCPVGYASYEDNTDDVDILVNTTPVGMFPNIGDCPVDIINNYVNLKAVLDVVYNPLDTMLVHDAKKRGLTATAGISMLVAQGYFASKLFLGKELGKDPVSELTDAEREKIENVTAELIKTVSNLVLTGMPGSGKSTVGKILAKSLGKLFSDTDEMFEKEFGISPGDCIRKDGEAHFRSLEKEIVKKAAAMGGYVIATGGGVILDRDNTDLLSLNGPVVYLHRKLSELATEGRPLSEGAENLKALYYKRLPIYMDSCDLLVCVKDSPEDVAKEIEARLEETEICKGSDIKRIKKGKDMKILILNGPNLNMLGIREPDIYGRQTYDDLVKLCQKKAKELTCEVSFYQSNHEGDLIDAIQDAYGVMDGIVINPGAYTHTSVAILDALKAVGIPAVEVHISDVDLREDFRQTSYIRSYVCSVISGHGLNGYAEAMEKLASL